MMRFLQAMLLLCLTVAGAAQATSGMQGYSRPSRDTVDPHLGTATVTGTVLDVESQHPVRLAQVMLAPVRAATNSRGDFYRGSSINSGRTAMDGSFLIEHVSAGDYYVVAGAEGYVSEQMLAMAQVNAGASADDALRSVPMVHVNEGGSANITVSIQHGSALGGTVQWGDGLSAAGVRVVCQPTQVSAGPVIDALRVLAPAFTSSMFTTVDDRGRFRISGLAQGDYVVSVYFQPNASSSFPSQMAVYYPGVFRQSEAKPVSVRLGEERNDLQMTIDLSGLHVVAGTVSSSTGSASVRSGTVSLRDTNDKTFRVSGAVQPDGTFTVNYVPPGTYTITVFASSVDRTTTDRHTAEAGVTFSAPSQTLTVTGTDVTGLAISVTPLKSN